MSSKIPLKKIKKMLKLKKMLLIIIIIIILCGELYQMMNQQGNNPLNSVTSTLEEVVEDLVVPTFSMPPKDVSTHTLVGDMHLHPSSCLQKPPNTESGRHHA